MMRTNTSSIERVDAMMQRSDPLYDTIDQSFDGEVRHRRMLRTGVNRTAILLREGVSISEAGEQLLTLPFDIPNEPGPLDVLGNQYADVQRATLDRMGNLETDSRHAFHLTHMAADYAAEFYPQLDQYKIAVYAWLHDLVEAYSGDVSSLGITPEQALKKHHDEEAALLQIKLDYGQQWPELLQVIDEYETLSTPEARFVKTFDKLDPGFTHFYSKGAQIKERYGYGEAEFLLAIDEATQRMERYSGEFPQLMEDRLELTKRVAQVAFKNAA